MLDRILALPAPVRHLILGILSVLLTWAGTDLVPFLKDQSNVYGGTVAMLLAAFLAVVTPLVTSYGYGSARAAQLGARTVTNTTSR